MFQKALDWYTKAGEGIASEATEEVRKHPEKCYKDEIIDGKKVRKILPYYMNKLHELMQANPLTSVILNNIGVCLIELGVTDHPKGATHVRPKGATGNAVFRLQTG
jgi:hypothetical protein